MTTTTIPGLFKKIRPPFKIHGGKSYLAMELRDTFDDAARSFERPGVDIYASVFGGAFSDGLNIGTYGQVDIYNDVDPLKVNLFERLRDDSKTLRDILSARTYDEGNFLFAKGVVAQFSDSEIDELRGLPPALRTALAAAFIVSSRFSRGGLGQAFAWSDRERGGLPGDVNAWLTFLRDDFERIAIRCRHLITRCDSYNALCNEIAEDAFNGLRVVAYFDPPYPKETRKSTRVYGRFELPNIDPPGVKNRCSHEHLLECIGMLDAAGARVAVSSYRNAMYDKRLESFERDEYDMPNNSGQGATKERRVEVVYRNFRRETKNE